MRSFPDYIQFYPTLRCNKSCGFCFNKGMPSMLDMPLENFRIMLGTLKRIGVRTIDIIGGEPTLHRDVVVMVRESERYGFSINLSSNGTDLETLAGILETAENTTVGVSINDRETLAQLEEFIKKHRTVVKTIFSPDLDFKMVEDILALRPKKFYLLFRDAMRPDEIGSTISFDRFLETIEQKFAPSMVGMVYCSGFLPDHVHCPMLLKARCPAGTAKLGIMPDGSVYPCNLLFGREELRLGNIFFDPFEAIWRHPSLAFFRTFTGNSCPRTSCTLHAACHGGCPALGLMHSKKLSAPDPRCVRS